MVAVRRKSTENGPTNESAPSAKKQMTEAITHQDEICVNTIRGFGADAPAVSSSLN